MRSTFLGFLIAPIIIYFALTDAIPNVVILLNVIGILVVVGGTISAGIMTYGVKEISSLAAISLKVVVRPKINEQKIISEIIRMSGQLKKIQRWFRHF